MLFTKEENKILQENNISEKVIKIFENHFQAKLEDSTITNKDLDLAIVKIQKEMLEMRNEFNLKMKDLEIKLSSIESNLEIKMSSIESNLEIKMSSIESNLEIKMSSIESNLEIKMSGLEVKMSGLESNMNKIETRIVWKILAILVSLLSPFYIQLLINIYKIAL